MLKRILKKIALSDNPFLQIVARMLRFPFNFFQFLLLGFHRDDREVIRLIKKVRKEVRMLLWSTEAYQIFVLARAAKKLSGDFAEFGVYEGASTKLICEAGSGKSIHLFDTFGGLPHTEDTLQEKQYTASFEQVKKYLSPYKNVVFHKGVFPDTARPIQDRTFSFVHLDVDLYKSTKDALDFFYPRMVGGGVILSHDYSALAGVRRAFDEFFQDKPELVIELSTTQCLVVKL